jgi:RNA polymerase sigma-70 factor, ECF subfamily
MMDSDRQDIGTPGVVFSNDVVSIAKKAIEGHRASFEELINIFQGEIFRMIFYRTRSRFDAEDLTQEVFLKAFKNIHILKNADRFRSWLFGIAVNCVRDFHRKKQFLGFFEAFSRDSSQEEQNNEKSPDTPPDHLMNKEFWQHVKNLSSRLSSLEREVFFLRFMDHLSIKEISHALNKNESTVKTHLYRSLSKFKEDSELVGMLEGEIR